MKTLMGVPSFCLSLFRSGRKCSSNSMNLDRICQYDYISFDVFDTLLTRRYLKPVHLFRDLEKQLVGQDSIFNNFAEIRIQSEFDVRKLHDFQVETNLEAIYKEIGNRLDISKEMVPKIFEHEISLEQKSMVVNLRAVELVRELRKLGKRIIYITDTYFSKLFIEKLLLNHGIMQNGETLYVSSELVKMKYNGDMFLHVLDDLNIRPEKLCHIGDNWKSDVEVPRQIGIEAMHYKEVFDSRYESYDGDDLLKSQLISISKATRLQGDIKDLHRQTIWNVTSDVSGPLVFFFVYWTLVRAVADNIQQVYYLSRDGQIMHKIASKIINTHFQGKVQARYLYVSRQALLFPALTELNQEAFEWIMAPTGLLTPKIILKRINVYPHEIYHLLKKFNFHDSLDKHLEGPERARFKEMLSEAATFILTRASQFREVARKYFEQEGLFDEKSLAVVDIGWSGTLQRSISRILDMFGKSTPIHGYYFGLRNIKKHKENDRLSAWFTEHDNPRQLDRKTYIVPMTEIFTAADHGGVKKYRFQNGVATPVLMKDVNEYGCQWGVNEQQKAMLAYADQALELNHEQLKKVMGDYIGWFERIYEKFLMSPTYQESKVYGSYMLAEDQNESYHTLLAKKYSLVELYKVRRDNFKHHHNEWCEGAMKLTFRNIGES